MIFSDLKLILVPTDFSPASTVALRAAIDLAKTFGAAVEVFHVDIDSSLLLPPPGDIIAVPLLAESSIIDASQRLEQAAVEVRAAGVTCTVASEFGRTHTTIVEHAVRVGAGLIVMGSHGRHGVKHAILGSVAEKVVAHAPCPVLIVPTAPRS